MNPIKLMLRIVAIFFINYAIAFILLISLLSRGFYSPENFLDRITAILIFLSSTFSGFIQWTNQTKDCRLNLKRQFRNQIYAPMMQILAITFCLLYDFGLFLDVTNFLPNDFYAKFYFVGYEVAFGGLTAFLIPELLKFIKDYAVPSGRL